MLAVQLHAVGEQLRVEELPDPEPSGTQVRIRVAGCGVCHTDLHIVDGTQTRVELPRVLGHEVAGWIDDAADEAAPLLRRAHLAAGDPVVVFGGWGCGSCADCRAGEEQRCPESRAPGFQEDGGYAELMLVAHPRHLVPLGELDPVRAAPLADAGVTSYRAVRRAAVWLRPGSRVLLIGCGALGQFAVQHLRGLRGRGGELLIAVRELDPVKLELAAELGADVGVLDGDVEMVLAAMGGPAGAVLDLVGNDATLALATSCVAPGGLISLVGESGGHVDFGFDRLPLEASLTTIGWGSIDDLHDVVSAARRERLRWEVESMPLVDAAEAHRRLRAGQVAGRLVLRPERAG